MISSLGFRILSLGFCHSDFVTRILSLGFCHSDFVAIAQISSRSDFVARISSPSLSSPSLGFYRSDFVAIARISSPSLGFRRARILSLGFRRTDFVAIARILSLGFRRHRSDFVARISSHGFCRRRSRWWRSRISLPSRISSPSPLYGMPCSHCYLIIICI
jgi:hypothetical protein